MFNRFIPFTFVGIMFLVPGCANNGNSSADAVTADTQDTGSDQVSVDGTDTHPDLYNTDSERIVDDFSAAWGPRLEADPYSLDFGVVAREQVSLREVELRSVGGEDVHITAIELSPDTNKNFSLDAVGDKPIVISPHKSVKIHLSYKPLSIPDGVRKVDEKCTLTVKYDSGHSLTVKMHAIGIDTDIPVEDFSMQARICDPPDCNPSDPSKCTTKTVGDHDIVPADTMIFMHDLSVDSPVGGGLVKWQWNESDTGHASPDFIPKATSQNPSICLKTGGNYTFGLTVTNRQGKTGKGIHKDLVVFPESALGIELTWHTPTDNDETDSCGPGKDCGSDMDLHFVNPKGKGKGLKLPDGSNPGYFSHPWDCFSTDPHPIWATHKPDHDPNLVLDDTDGAGPELIILKQPQTFANNECYRVGVHYFDDKGFGDSLATVRVYGNKTLLWKNQSPVKMAKLDLWDAAMVCLDANTGKPVVTPIKDNQGNPVIYHDVKDQANGQN